MEKIKKQKTKWTLMIKKEKKKKTKIKKKKKRPFDLISSRTNFDLC